MPAKDLKLKAEIEKVMSGNKAYGHRRIAYALSLNKKRVLRVMKLFGLEPQRRRGSPKKPEDIGQSPMTIPNLLKGRAIDAQGKVWVSDFTYLPYYGKFAYLATFEDLFTREIVGWALSLRHDADLICEALLWAL